MALQVPGRVGPGVALDDGASRVAVRVSHDGVKALDPFATGVGDRLLDERVAPDRQYDVHGDTSLDGLVQHDEVGARRGGRDDGGRMQGGQQVRHPGGDGWDLCLGEPHAAPAGGVDPVASMHQQHLGRVLPPITAGGR